MELVCHFTLKSWSSIDLEIFLLKGVEYGEQFVEFRSVITYGNIHYFIAYIRHGADGLLGICFICPNESMSGTNIHMNSRKIHENDILSYKPNPSVSG